MLVDVKPAEVTLFEDRAHVTRRGRVTLPFGESTLRIEGVAPVLADRTLVARLSGAPEGAVVIEARAVRRDLARLEQRPEEVRALEVKQRELEERFAASRELMNQRNTELAWLNEALARTTAEIAEEAAWGRGTAAQWEPHLREVSARQAALREELSRLATEHRKLERQRADLAGRVAALASPASGLRCDVEIRVSAPLAGVATLECSYTVPGACWRPAHTARLTGAKLAFSTDGCVWQNTGEDWNDVALKFSTQRLERGLEPPKLVADTVTAQRKQQALVVETREQEVQHTGLGAGGVRAAEVPGIDDGGETRHLTARAPASVPSDGRPHRVPIGGFEASAKTSWVLMAELSPAVHMRTEQVNNGTLPLLAGPVDLVRDSGAVGSTRVLFVAPGETFELGWGPDGALRAHRDHLQMQEEASLLGALSAWTSRDHRVILKLSNLGDEPRTIDVTERVPVSEVEKLQIAPEAPDTTGQKTPDRDGFVRWEVALPAFGHAEVKLRYKVKKHKDVIER